MRRFAAAMQKYVRMGSTRTREIIRGIRLEKEKAEE